MAQDDDARPGRVFLRSEIASKLRLNAKQIEEIGRNTAPIETFGFTVPSEIKTALRHRGHPREDAVLALPIEKISRRRRVLREPEMGLLVPHHHELVRVLERQRAQQDGIDHAEDRGVRSDPERERGDRHNREAGVLGQRPQTVADILQKLGRPHQDPLAPRRLFHLFQPAKFTTGGIPRLLSATCPPRDIVPLGARDAVPSRRLFPCPSVLSGRARPSAATSSRDYSCSLGVSQHAIDAGSDAGPVLKFRGQLLASLRR